MDFCCAHLHLSAMPDTGERISLEEGDYVVLDERAVTDRSIAALMPIVSSSSSSSYNKIMRRKVELIDLYRDLGVATLDKSGRKTDYTVSSHSLHRC